MATASLSLPRRPRRLRATATLRELVRETEVRVADLILPLFVSEKISAPVPVGAMPGVSQLPLEAAVELAHTAHTEEGLRAVLLFGIPKTKDEEASGAWAEDGVVQRTVRALKKAAPELLVVTDVCLCEYMSHGHCGVVQARGDGGFHVANDPSVEFLARTAISHAAAGADLIAPSDMMDGRIGAIRAALDDRGFSETPVMSYAAKFASAFYGPFREAAEGAPKFGDRRTYQMDPANAREALREVETRHRRSRGHRHGQAGPGVSRRALAGEGTLQPADRGLQRLAANTRCSRPPPRTAGWTSAPPSWNR